MAKKVVWDLFGGLNGSVGLAIGYEEYDIYTIDILPETKDGRKNIVVNLATTEPMDLYPILDTLPKPDIIVASPMCVSWSTASAMKGGSAGWIYDENKEYVHLRPKEHFRDESINRYKTTTQNRYWRYEYENIRPRAILGKWAIENTINIIKKYKPESWYIENPATSLIWNYINYNLKFNDQSYIKNLTHYGAYDAPNKKPTIFLSNKKLNLKVTEKGYRNKLHWEMIKRKDRSDIPEQLIKDIFKKFNEVNNG